MPKAINALTVDFKEGVRLYVSPDWDIVLQEYRQSYKLGLALC